MLEANDWHVLCASRAACCLLAAVALLAAFSLQVLTLPVIFTAPVACGVLAAGSLAIRRYALRRAPDSIRAIRLLPSGKLEVRRHDGGILQVRVCGESSMLGPLVVLRLQSPDEPTAAVISAIVMSDSIDQEGLRRLRAWLRWKADLSSTPANA